MGGGQLSLIDFLRNLDQPLFNISQNELPVFNSECTSNEDSDNKSLPKSIRRRLQKVAEFAAISNTQIDAIDFLAYYKDVTGYPLILYDLGYRYLSDLIDDIPEIFSRKVDPWNTGNYFIYPASNFESEVNENYKYLGVMEHFAVSLLLERVISNVRKILEAYPEGLNFQELEHLYNINYKDSSLQEAIESIGFDDLDMLISSVKNRVSFRFSLVNGEKYIHLVNVDDSSSESDECNMVSETHNKKAVPFDGVIPEFDYKIFTFALDFDFSKFTPVLVSAAAHPGGLYIQREEANDLRNILEELNNFYNGNESEQYMMKNIHIKVGASCIAKSSIGQWYRAEILVIPTVESVLVQFVDFGIKETIDKSSLRYAKKEFINLPAQALKCRLAYIRPPKNATKWSVESRNRILSLCTDVPLMAKVVRVEYDGIYSIVLCDTSGDENVYIHEVLIKEGFAAYDFFPSHQNISRFYPWSYLHSLQKLETTVQETPDCLTSVAEDPNSLKLSNEDASSSEDCDNVHQSTGTTSNTMLL